MELSATSKFVSCWKSCEQVILRVGVTDPGLGAAFGINILSTDEEIEETADTFVKTVRTILGVADKT